MFRKLHWQMTLFSAAITSLILITLSFVCLMISENSLKKNTEASFQKEVSSIITHLQSQSYISLPWLIQLQGDNHFVLYFYDNGSPLFSQHYASDAGAQELAALAKDTALRYHGMDILSTRSGVLPVHTEFPLTDSTFGRYYVSAGIIHKANGNLGFLILYSLEAQETQLRFQRLLFSVVDLAAIVCLSLFSWFFTGRMLLPIEQSQNRQTHFVAAASHELRAPLTVILSGADALEKADTPAERSHFLRMIRAEGTRMQHLIADMLFLARSDAGSFPVALKSCQPDLLLLDAYEKFDLPVRQKGLTLRLKLPEGQLPLCRCDPERVAQVLSVLLDNAISYTPSGGQITLSLAADRRRSGIRFGVADTGPGIPNREKQLIFDRFYRSLLSRKDKNHFGLGLSIAKEVTVSMHGALWIEDVPGKGAAFYFTLPTG